MNRPTRGREELADKQTSDKQSALLFRHLTTGENKYSNLWFNAIEEDVGIRGKRSKYQRT